jgi:hypothetical protein
MFVSGTEMKNQREISCYSGLKTWYFSFKDAVKTESIK